MAELQLGFEEVRFEPVDGGVVELVVEEGCGGRTGDAPTCGDDLFVLFLDDGIADAGVSGGHLRTAMAEDGEPTPEAGKTTLRGPSFSKIPLNQRADL